MVPLKRDMLGCIIFGSIYMKYILVYILYVPVYVFYLCLFGVLYLECYIWSVIFRVLFVWGRLVCVHENREPLDWFPIP